MLYGSTIIITKIIAAIYCMSEPESKCKQFKKLNSTGTNHFYFNIASYIDLL